MTDDRRDDARGDAVDGGAGQAPEGTVTLSETVAAGWPLVSATTAPPAGAAPSSVTVPDFASAACAIRKARSRVSGSREWPGMVATAVGPA